MPNQKKKLLNKKNREDVYYYISPKSVQSNYIKTTKMEIYNPQQVGCI